MGNQQGKDGESGGMKKSANKLFSSNADNNVAQSLGLVDEEFEGEGGKSYSTKKFKYENKNVNKWKEKEFRELLQSSGFDYLAEEFFQTVTEGKNIENLSSFDMEDMIKDPKRKHIFRVLCHHLKILAKDKEKFRYSFFVCLDKTIRAMPIESMDDINYADFIYNCEVLSDEKLLQKHFIKLQGRGKGNEQIHVKIIVTENIFRARQIMARKIISPLIGYIPQLRPEFGFFHTAIIVGGIYFQWTDSELIIPKEVAASGAAFLAMGSDLNVAASPNSSPVKKTRPPRPGEPGFEDEEEIPAELTVLQDQTPLHSLRITKTEQSGRDLSQRGGKGKTKKSKSKSKSKLKLSKLMTIEEIEAELARIVVKWNTVFRYKSVKPIGAKDVGNCQDFVKDICESLSISMDPDSGPLRHYLEKLRKKGRYKLTFKVSGKMAQDPLLGKFLTRKKYLFDTHEDLDNFVWSLDEASPGWKFDYNEEISLLKAFDRAFWLRHLKKNSEDPKYKPSKKGCYFDDPRNTKYDLKFVHLYGISD